MLVILFLVPLLLFAAPVDRSAFVGQYCAGCHNSRVKAGSFVLDEFATATALAREKVIRKVGGGEMPPPGAKKPEPALTKAFIDDLVRELDDAARRNPFAGRGVIRRLNRTEYTNAVRDLLAIDLPLAASLPQDGVAAGFDNIGDALSMSPLLLERYLKVARRVSELAVGVADPAPVTEIYPATKTQAAWQGEGLPFGTRGGIRVNHYFSHDGDYDLRAFLVKESLTPKEGVRFFRTRVNVKAGSHSVVVAFPDEWTAREGPVSDVAGPGGRALGGPLDLLGTAIRPTIDFRVDGRRVKLFEIAGMSSGEAAFDGLPGPPSLGRIEIAGPYNATGVSETASQRRIFVCRPANAAEEPACATRILSAIARRAFRRDVTGADIGPYAASFHAARQKRGFDESIAVALRDILLAPDFLFRLEFDQPSKSGGVAPVSGFELASRLSFFLWSSPPDDALLDRAGALRQPAAIEQTVRRMLADPRSSALISNFAAQWLGLRDFESFEPDKQTFPDYDPELAGAFETETRLFVQSVMRENRSLLDLVAGDYTYLNERLARHYGIAGVTGPGFRRVQLPAGSLRGGLLGQGSILTLTSHTATTSPVLRGKWILENILASPPPPPPANVPKLDEGPASGRKLTLREKMESHRANPTCAACHSRIDPLGFALEKFDGIGRYRTEDGGPIDDSGSMPSGEKFSGPDGLKRLLAAHPEQVTRAAVEKLMTYALGRELEGRDQPTVREILRAAAPGGYRFHDLVIGIVKSVPFQMREVREQ
ncbi:MAG: DUF1592 domain-containing protein [Bryobacteraceae bacterium]